MSDTLREVRVKAIGWEADGILSVELRAPDGQQLPPFTAGAHIDLHLPNGMVRSYSLLNDPAETQRYVIAVALDPATRGGSKFVHEQLRVGQMVKISGPLNHFPLAEQSKTHVLIAGGIGVTPMLAMLRRLSTLRRDVDFYYAVREQGRRAFTEDILALCGHARLHVDAEHGGPLDIERIIAAHPDAEFYCCGPQPMLAAFERATAALPPERVHLEYFSAKPQEAEAASQGFDVECRKSGRSVHIPADMSIADALMAAGISVTLSCGEGVCGTCETRVLAGEVDHRDTVLSHSEKAAGKSMMICVSRSKGDKLVLDI
jgi:tetrachlorobenzoquinone reductase